ncbi:hypothetical protein GCM10027590_60530 [Nocardiopsis nanhaiensis]
MLPIGVSGPEARSPQGVREWSSPGFPVVPLGFPAGLPGCPRGAPPSGGAFHPRGLPLGNVVPGNRRVPGHDCGAPTVKIGAPRGASAHFVQVQQVNTDIAATGE